MLHGKGIVDDSERGQFVINWAACAVAAAALAIKLNLKEKESERASKTLKNKNKNSSSEAVVDGYLHKLDDKSDIYAACEHPVILRLLQLLCGVASVLGSDLDDSDGSRGKRKGNKLLHFDDTLAASDAEQQVDLYLDHVSCTCLVLSCIVLYCIVLYCLVLSCLLLSCLLHSIFTLLFSTLLYSNIILFYLLLDEKHFNDIESAAL